MYVIGHQVGKLVEVRIWGPTTPSEAMEWERELGTILRLIPGRYACLLDLHDAQVFPQPVADVVLATMRNDNAKLERTAVLVGQSATLGFQIQRMIMEASLPRRRMFQSAGDLEPWLGEVLSEPEKHRLHALLVENNRFDEDPDEDQGNRSSVVPMSFIPQSYIPQSHIPVSQSPSSHTPSSHSPSSHSPGSGPKRPPGSGRR